MNWKCYAGCAALFVLGCLVGSSAGGGKYSDGRLSACNDMMKVVVGLNPLMALAQPKCVSYKGDAAIQIGGKLYSLDGSKELN